MSNDPFDLPDDDEVPAPQDEARQKREAAEIRKKLKAAEEQAKELEELRAFREEREKADKALAASQVFKEIGLQPEWAEFYTGEEVTPAAVKQWAVEKKFLQPEEGQEAPAPAPATTGFTPTVIEGGSTLGSKTYSEEEFTALLRDDPKKAEAVYKAGRLKKEEPEWAYSSRFYGRDT